MLKLSKYTKNLTRGNLLALLILAIFLVGTFVFVPQKLQQAKDKRVALAMVKVLLSRGTSKEEEAVRELTIAQSSGLLGYRPSKADSFEEYCEGAADIAEYWWRVSQGEYDDPIPDLLEWIRENEPDDINEILEYFNGEEGDIRLGNLMTGIDELTIEQFVELLENSSSQDIYDAVADVYEESGCNEFGFLSFGSGFGSSSGMGSGSY